MLFQRQGSMFVKPVEHVSLFHLHVAVSKHDYFHSRHFLIFVYLSISDILKFDNSYSWARSKEIFYSVNLLPPGIKPHLHVPPGEMEVVGSSPGSNRSSEFYDCDETFSESQNGAVDQVGGACCPGD